MQSIVFKACTELQKKTRAQAFHLKEIRKFIPVETLNDEQLGAVLRVLDNESALHFDEASGKVYM